MPGLCMPIFDCKWGDEVSLRGSSGISARRDFERGQLSGTRGKGEGGEAPLFWVEAEEKGRNPLGHLQNAGNDQADGPFRPSGFAGRPQGGDEVW